MNITTSTGLPKNKQLLHRDGHDVKTAMDLKVVNY